MLQAENGLFICVAICQRGRLELWFLQTQGHWRKVTGWSSSDEECYYHINLESQAAILLVQRESNSNPPTLCASTSSKGFQENCLFSSFEPREIEKDFSPRGGCIMHGCMDVLCELIQSLWVGSRPKGYWVGSVSGTGRNKCSGWSHDLW